MLKRGLAFALLLVSALVYAEPLPGLLDGAQMQRLQEEASAQKQAAQAMVRGHAKKLGYSDADVDQALTPAMHRSGSLQVELNDGPAGQRTVIEFPWARTGFAENELANTGKIKNSTRKETNKGGLRVHHGVFADEVYALALKMDTKLATAQDALDGHAIRGAKGGIGAGKIISLGRDAQGRARVGDYMDPASPIIDRQHLMRSFAAAFQKSGGAVGPGKDIQAGDVNTKAPEMKTLSEAYGGPKGLSPGVSGKAVTKNADGSIDPNGGIEFRGISTGEGVWTTARLAAKRAGVKLYGSSVMAQGWGEVGRAFGQAAVRDGARLVGIEEVWNVGGKKIPGTLLSPKGVAMKPRETKAWLAAVEQARTSGEDITTAAGGRFAKFFHAGKGAHDFTADIVGVNALGDVLNEKTVPRLVATGTHQGKRKVIVEGANLAETVGGAKLLDHHKEHLLVVPGDLANLGGVHVSNMEAAQNVYGEAVDDKRAKRSLQSTMLRGWRRAVALADKHGISERSAVELSAVDAMMKRSLQHKDAPKVSIEKRVIGRMSPPRAKAFR